jgi:hypothetical protein
MKKTEASSPMNDNFWKSQFVKHDATSGSGMPVQTKAPPHAARIAPKAAAWAEAPETSRPPSGSNANLLATPPSSLENALRAVRATQATLSFEKFVSLVLLKFPAKAGAQWEGWLLNQKAALMKKWNLSE